MVTDEKGARLDYSAGSEPNTIVSLHQHTSAKVERVWIRTSDRSPFRGIHSTYGDDIPVLKHDNKQTRYYSQRVNLIRLMFKVEFKLNALRSWLQMTNNSTWKTRQLNCFFVHYLRLTAIHTDEAILIMSECKRMNFFIFGSGCSLQIKHAKSSANNVSIKASSICQFRLFEDLKTYLDIFSTILHMCGYIICAWN